MDRDTHTLRVPKEADIDRLLELTGGSVYLMELHCRACCRGRISELEAVDSRDDNFFSRYV